ncbi:MAG: hybrid non-ribosomal peptide synthetase/type I polyketide synthase [Limisphaerales bacterium]
MSATEDRAEGIAIIGMAGRFPRAKDLEAFWQNLRNGTESVSFFSEAELEADGVDVPANHPDYVKAGAILEEADRFDAGFFGITPREAELMDPQHRLALECAWEALENAGCDSAQYAGSIGVFFGMSLNTYLQANLLSHPEWLAAMRTHQVVLANDKDYLPMRVAYKLNLRGPSLAIQTACSTSLVAVCVACQNLLSYQCDVALAGGVSIGFPQKRGYWYQEGGIASPDGHCRAFDANAGGTVTGEGVGVVVLKRLADALEDGDPIRAVIKGFAINNDGASKVGFSAPSVTGQAEVVALAQAMAGFAPDTIGYIEAHGTATPLGDPIEIAALTKAFRTGTSANNFCAIGSVKTNIGHLDAAAGVAGLIKTVLALQHQLLPPSLHFEKPNPKIDFADSPFYVNARPTEWKAGSTPRRAGVSSFGIGGTNAHVVLEEAPAAGPSGGSRPAQLLVLSAKTGPALDRATANLAAHLEQHPELDLADIACTLHTGRRAFDHRRMLVCRDRADAIAALAAGDPKRVLTRLAEEENPPVLFLFPGQGSQRINMGRELYELEPVFREQVDQCADRLAPHLGLDLRALLYPGSAPTDAAEARLAETSITQPALFVIEYALARLWMSWGVRPQAMIGHSSGEYVAACLAGVFSLDDALRLVATRGRLMQELPRGAMLAVRLPEEKLQELLTESLSLAAVNGPNLCSVSGPIAAIDSLQARLVERAVACRRLPTSHAFHSAMMDPILEPFADVVKNVPLSAPQIPYASNISGRWVTAAEATSPDYWVGHIRQTVRFAEGVSELLREPGAVLLEIGPGRALSNLVQQHPSRNSRQLVVASLPQHEDQRGDVSAVLNALGQVWLAGLRVDWPGFYAHEHRRRVHVPAYPFERQRYWIESARAAASREPRPAPSPSGPAEAHSGLPSAPEKISTSSHVASPKERMVSGLKALLGDLSGLRDIDAAATFVELGLDSLFLTQVSQGIEKRFGVRVAFRQLLEEFPTLDQLADHLGQSLPVEDPSAAANPSAPSPGRESPTAAERNSKALAGEADGESRVLPLTEGQKEIWFAAQIGDNASCAFNESCLVSFRGPVDEWALREAAQALVERHEALRTTFSPTGDSQRIHRHLACELMTTDLRDLPGAERKTQSEALFAEAVKQPFDLTRGPLWRARLVRVAEQEQILVLTFHHIVCDGGSIGIVVQQLAALYAAAYRRNPPPPPVPLQFGDYVRSQTALEQDADAVGDEDFWLKQFAGKLPVLDLPTDRARPAVRSFRGMRASCTLGPAVSRSLRQWSAQRGGTLFTTLLAGYYALLHRWTGQDDIVVGVPLSGRALPGGDTLVGHCISFLPVRVRLAADTKFTAHLEAVKQTFFDALDHRHYAFGRLIRRLNLPRDRSRMPLVSATFTLDRVREGLQFSDVPVAIVPNAKVFSNFDLSFSVLDTGDELKLDCRYNTDLFEADTIRRLLGHFQTLLAGIVADPEQRLSRLPLLTDAERHQLLVDWNRTDADYPHDRCLHHLFEHQACLTPDAVAVVCEEQSLTYRQLDHRANRLAHQLRRLGVGPDALVALCLERSLDLVVGLWAILKAGGAYVPLDPAYPHQRLAWMLEDSRAAVLVTQQSLRSRWPELSIQILCVDDSTPAAGAEAVAASEPPASAVTPDHLAYVIYTSGSTGKPKGVMITHRNVVNFLHSMRQQPGLAHDDVLLAVTTLSFDIAGLELYLPLTVGAKVVLASREAAADGRQLSALIEACGPTVMQATPSTWRLLLGSGWVGSPRLTVLCGGEALPADLAGQLRSHSAAVWNLYGPTETTIWSTRHRVQPGTGPVPIGRPIANTQVYILDRHLAPLPIGVPGELHLGGDGLARGYLNQIDLTAEKFVPDPFSEQRGARLYRTGDLARYRADGAIEFLGRIDHQVKIRGHRIELGEVESVLAQHPAVRQCVVGAREDTPGEARLVAYLVPAAEPAANAAELLPFLREKLPAYMLPSAFVVLEHLPLTPNGKVDRRALPAPDPARPELGETFLAPQTATELAVANIWREVLRLERVGVNDGFFDLGGHSVLAAQVLSRIAQACGVDVPLRALFEAPTVRALASAIDRAQRQPRADSAPIKDPNGVDSAEALLARMDQLSDANVDSLLGDLLSEEEVNR